ncbi:MAG: type II secretion system protein [Armatimonadota bacterium]
MMLFTHFTARRRGFTLIEMLIVIVVIAILAIIVIARVLGVSRKGKEAALRANLYHLRTAITAFEADCGVYPEDLDDLVSAIPPANGAGGVAIVANTYKGPYLTTSGGIGGTGIPENPLANASSTVGENWSYTAVEGKVTSAVTGTTIDGIQYTSL